MKLLLVIVALLVLPFVIWLALVDPIEETPWE